MPEEFSRTTKRKRVLFPDEDPDDPDAMGVNVPIITNISFVDPVKRAQEYQYSIDNSVQGDRTVHVDNVFPGGDDGSEPDLNQEPLRVQRIDKWRVIDPVERGQEYEITLDNVTGNDLMPPRFITHLKTHVVRYRNDPDDGNWIDSELIDQLSVVDPVNRGQETILSLNNPPGEFDADGHEVLKADPNDPDITDSNAELDNDPAWRTDPFQNIINWGSDFWLVIGFTISSDSTSALCPVGGSEIDNIHLNDIVYLQSVFCGLNFDPNNVGMVSPPDPTVEAAVGASFSYGGGGIETIGSFDPNEWFAYPAVLCEDAPADNFYQDFKLKFGTGPATPVYFDTLSVTVNAWSFTGDTLMWKVTGVPSPANDVGFMQSATLLQGDVGLPPSHDDLVNFGSICASRTFDFSGIVVTYHGAHFDSVAVHFGSKSQSISVLCKRRQGTA
jgi:hypothetical protein